MDDPALPRQTPDPPLPSDPPGLSKSRLLAFRQCPRRLWLEVHRPDLAVVDAGTQRVFAQGHEVGAIAREIFGPGPVLDYRRDGSEAVVQETARLLRAGATRIYEAAFSHEGVLILADVLERAYDGYRLVEVKSASSVKPVYLDDCAIQSWVVAGAGLTIESISVAHIDTAFVYRRSSDYTGLLKVVPVTSEAHALRWSVATWVGAAKAVVTSAAEPTIQPGRHCHSPYECPFLAHCSPAPAEYPLTCLPYGAAMVRSLAAEGIRDVRNIPPGRLEKPIHQKVWEATRSGRPIVAPEAAEILRAHPYPHYFLDFETISFAVPRWIGTSPYEALPFQWSLHVRQAEGSVEEAAFLDITGDAPMRRCAELLLDALGQQGTIYTYSAYERTVMSGLAEAFPDLKGRIDAANERLFDLLPFLKAHYYHPAMRGSWSIKSVLPTVDPDLAYGRLDVQDGGAAQTAYLKMVDPQCAPDRQEILRHQLLAYCRQDSLGMMRIVDFIKAGACADGGGLTPP